MTPNNSLHFVIVSPHQEMRLMDGSTGLSVSMRKMIDVANSEPPPQVEDDEGTAVVVDAPPSQTVAQAPSEILTTLS